MLLELVHHLHGIMNKMYTSILQVKENRIALYMPFDNLSQAQNHIDKFINDYPHSFIYEGEYNCDLWIENQVVSIKKEKIKVNNISAIKLRRELLARNISTLIDQNIENEKDINKKSLINIDFEYSINFSRDNENIIYLLKNIGFNDNDIDDFFYNASLK